jgi:hypothetical protein
VEAQILPGVRWRGPPLMLSGAKRAVYASFAAACALACAGCGSDAAAQPRLVPSLVELEPAIFCIDAALEQSEVLECLNRHGITSDYRYPEQPRTAEDFKRQVLVMWATIGRDGAARLSPQHFDSAIDYATCIEEATNALPGLEGEPRAAIGRGRTKAELTCADQFLSTQSVAKRHPGLLKGETGDLPEGEMEAYLLARTFAGAAYNYVIEANGWVTAQMRPCVRYVDGRPPSPSCAGMPEPRAPPPPPGPRAPDSR